jgi:hypothetical protein
MAAKAELILRAYFKPTNYHPTLCAFGFNFAPLRENPFTQRRKVKTEGAKEDGGVVL